VSADACSPENEFLRWLAIGAIIPGLYGAYVSFSTLGGSGAGEFRFGEFGLEVSRGRGLSGERISMEDGWNGTYPSAAGGSTNS